jgi:hypothetical protein
MFAAANRLIEFQNATAPPHYSKFVNQFRYSRRVVRVVEGARLESAYAAKLHQEFESLTLRKNP